MKPPTMSQRERRSVVGGVAFVTLLVLGFRIMPAWFAWSARVRDDSRLAVAQAASAYATITAGKARQESLLVRASRLVTANRRLIAGVTPSTAAANLASVLSREAEEAGLLVSSLQPRVDSMSWGAKRVSVIMEATGDIGGLTDFLLGVEGSEALLAVRSLSVTQPEPGAPDDRMEVLRLRLVVSGLMRSSVAALARGR